MICATYVIIGPGWGPPPAMFWSLCTARIDEGASRALLLRHTDEAALLHRAVLGDPSAYAGERLRDMTERMSSTTATIAAVESPLRWTNDS